MKKNFQLTEEEMAEMKEIAKIRTAVLMIGSHVTGSERQEAANAFWKRLGEKYGFDWNTVGAVPGKDHYHFSAEVTTPA